MEKISDPQKKYEYRVLFDLFITTQFKIFDRFIKEIKKKRVKPEIISILEKDFEEFIQKSSKLSELHQGAFCIRMVYEALPENTWGHQLRISAKNNAPDITSEEKKEIAEDFRKRTEIKKRGFDTI